MQVGFAHCYTVLQPYQSLHVSQQVLVAPVVSCCHCSSLKVTSVGNGNSSLTGATVLQAFIVRCEEKKWEQSCHGLNAWRRDGCCYALTLSNHTQRHNKKKSNGDGFRGSVIGGSLATVDAGYCFIVLGF